MQVEESGKNQRFRSEVNHDCITNQSSLGWLWTFPRRDNLAVADEDTTFVKNGSRAIHRHNSSAKDNPPGGVEGLLRDCRCQRGKTQKETKQKPEDMYSLS